MYKEHCLSINCAQSVKVEKGKFEYEKYFTLIPVPFKTDADFECNLKGVKSFEGYYTKNIKIMFLVLLLTRLFVLMIDLTRKLLFLEVKMLLTNLLKQFLRSISTKKK